MKKSLILKIITEVSRHQMSLLLCTTVLNLYFMAAGRSLALTASFLIPQHIAARAYVAASGREAFALLFPAGCFLAALCMILYALCIYFSYYERGWLLCGAALTALDAAFVIRLIISPGGSGYVVELVFHIWVIAALSAGYFAPALVGRLKNIPE